MAATEVEHLVKMANQIAINMSAWGDEDEVVQKVAEHLRKFWTPAMRRRLREYAPAGEESALLPLAERALASVSRDTGAALV